MDEIERLLELGHKDLEAGYPEYARQYLEKVLALDSANREAIDALARANEILSHRVAAAQKWAEEQSRKRARAHEPVRARTHIDGPITSGTRTALLRSLTELLGEPISDEVGTYWDAPPSYEEQLREVDLKVARLDRERRKLARERSRKEKMLEEVEGMMRDTVGLPLRQLSGERDELIGELDEVNLSITQLDRDRRKLRKKRKKIETFLGLN